MGRFPVNGVWIEAATFKEAREKYFKMYPQGPKQANPVVQRPQPPLLVKSQPKPGPQNPLQTTPKQQQIVPPLPKRKVPLPPNVIKPTFIAPKPPVMPVKSSGFVFYREDDRAWDKTDAYTKTPLKETGFEAWVQLGSADIRTLVGRFNERSRETIKLTEQRAKWISEMIATDYRYKGCTCDLESMGQLIKSKVDRSTIQISTGLTKDGGGRGKKHLYRIEVKKPLYVGNLRTNMFTKAGDSADFNVVVRAKLILDATTLAAADKVVALSIVGKEVSFLTPIPPDWISPIW